MTEGPGLRVPVKSLDKTPKVLGPQFAYLWVRSLSPTRDTIRIREKCLFRRDRFARMRGRVHVCYA